jgi:hypothetical protein
MAAHTNTTCKHTPERTISTAAGKFCLDCGQLLTRKTTNKIIIRHDSTRLPKTVSDIKPIAKAATGPVKIKTANISGHHGARVGDNHPTKS